MVQIVIPSYVCWFINIIDVNPRLKNHGQLGAGTPQIDTLSYLPGALEIAFQTLEPGSF